MRKWKKSLLMATAMTLGALHASALAQEAVFELDPLIITATRVGQRPLDIAAGTSVITAREIERKGAVTLADAVEGAAGVTISRYGGRGGTAIPYINGSDLVVVMLDGVRLNTVQGISSGSGGIDMNNYGIDVNAIDRIEVIRGGNSALYGADAVGGVIQIFTKKHYEGYSSNLGLAFGNNEQMQFKLGTAGKKDKWDWRFNANFYEDGGERVNSYSRDKDFSMRVGRELHEGDLFFNYTYNYHKAGQPGSLSWSSAINYGYENNHIMSFGYKKNDFTLQYYYKDRDYKGVSGSLFKHNETTHGILYQDSRRLDKNHLLTWGTDMFVADVESSNFTDTKKRWKRSFYLQDTMTLGKFIITPSIMYDMNNDFDNKFLPKISGVYKIDNETSFFANWGKVYRAPSFNDLYWYEDWGYGMGMFGNPDLKPETGWTMETGFKKKFGDKHEASISYFRRLLKDRINWTSDAWGSVWQAENIDSYSASGFTIDWTGKFDEHFKTNVNYSYVDTNTSKAGYNEPRNQFYMGLHYDNRDFSQSLIINGRSAKDQNSSSYVGGRILLNTSTRYKIAEKQTLFVNFYNLLDKDYFDVAGYPATGRTYLAGWEVKF